MQYARLGLGGPTISRLASAALRPEPGSSGTDAALIAGSQQAARLIGQALDAGINLFDAAACLDGAAESMLAAALGKRRAEVLVSSRLGARRSSAHSHPGLSRSDIIWSLEQSLQRLGSDWLDLCVVPHEDPHTPLEETLQALDEIVRAGKVRYLGFANWPAWKAARALELQKANGWAPFSFGEMHYSLSGRSLERETIPMLHSYGLGLILKNPPAGNPDPASNTVPGRSHLPCPELPEAQRSSYRLAEQMRDMAARHQVSISQIALAWLLSRDAVTSIVPAAATPAQQQDELDAATLQLTPADLLLLDAASTPIPLSPDWFSREADRQTTQAVRQKSCA